MKTVFEQLRENIERWEVRGRGVLTFAEPVSPRPPFVPFPGHRLREYGSGDDGVRHTKISGLLAKLSSLVRGTVEQKAELPISDAGEENEQINPDWCGEELEPVELRVRLPAGTSANRDSVVPFLTNLSLIEQPLAFEIIGTSDESWVQWAASASDADEVGDQLQAHFPGVKVSTGSEGLQKVCRPEAETAIVELALGNAFMWPLASVKHEPFVGLIGALEALLPGEAGIFQVIFTPVFDPWAESTLAAVTKADGKPFFDDGASLVKAAAEKTDGPLFGAVVRLAGIADDYDRAWQIVRRMAPALRHFARADGNKLVPLHNDDYDEVEHVMDLLQRRSRRCGMLLNLDELSGLVHLPSAAVQSKKFKRIETSTRAAEGQKTEGAGVCIGINQHDGSSTEVRLTQEQRVRHCHILGGTGTGKSTLLFSMIQQDIHNGEGIAVLDPHGDLIDRVLGIIPPERLCDVVLLDPADEQFVIPFNILSAHSDFEKQLLASDLVSVFQRLSTSWGDQMNSVFQNAVLAFLESTEGGTLADLRRFLLDADWRGRFLQTVADPDVRFYWQRAFPQLGGNKSIGPIITRLETLLSPKPIRFMVSQRENRLDFGAMMDTGKIFLAKLPQGQIGRENAFLLGSLVMTKLQQMAMSRARVPAAMRRPFYCYIDEFHHFITPSLAEVLSGARKYGLGLVLAHQDLKQLDRDKDVGSSVLSNAFTRIVFRVGDSDARALSEGFAHFEARDLQSLAIRQAICRIERADHDFNLSVPLLEPVPQELEAHQRAAAIEASHSTYAIARREVEAALLQKLEADELSIKVPKEKKPRDPIEETDSQPKAPPSDGEQFLKAEEVAAKQKVETLTVETPAPTPAQVGPVLTPAREEPLGQAIPAELGKGGHQHRILQDRIRAVGEQQGFRAILEMPTTQGRESIDVGLIRSDLRIACEISVTTTVDYEVGNVRKCLREGFDLVAVVSSSERKLSQIESAVTGCLNAVDVGKVKYFQLEDFLRYLGTLTPSVMPLELPSAPTPKESVRKGYKVTRQFAPLTPEERATKEAAALKLLLEEMKLPPVPFDQGK
jgi:hypothetical protein